MQRIKEYINTHGLCKEAGDKNIEIHSQNGKHGNAGGKKNTVHSQYHAPRDMVERYVNVAKLVGGKDYIIRAVSMFVSRDDPKTTLTSSADRKMFLNGTWIQTVYLHSLLNFQMMNQGLSMI